MMLAAAQAHPVLSPATLHSGSGTACCHCITRSVAVPDR
jgi:hypothetical protein